jgi:hypothetical protein
MSSRDPSRTAGKRLRQLNTRIPNPRLSVGNIIIEGYVEGSNQGAGLVLEELTQQEFGDAQVPITVTQGANISRFAVVASDQGDSALSKGLKDQLR